MEMILEEESKKVIKIDQNPLLRLATFSYKHLKATCRRTKSNMHAKSFPSIAQFSSSFTSACVLPISFSAPVLKQAACNDGTTPASTIDF